MSTDKKISQLTSGAPAQAGDEYVVARSGANFKLTLTNIAANMPATTISSGDLVVSSGNVGIGTGTPATKLDIFAADNATTSIRLGGTAASGGGATATVEVFGNRSDGNSTFYGRYGASFRRADGTAINNQTVGAYLFGGQWGTSTSFQSANMLYAASIAGFAESSWTSATAMPTAITFSTGSSGGVLGSVNQSYGTERMRIDSSGNVGIGGTADASDKVCVKGTLPVSSNTSAAFINRATASSSNTGVSYGFASLASTEAASFTLGSITGYGAFQGTFGAGSTVTNQYGFFTAGLSGATNNFGFYSDIASGSNRWNFYAAGTAANYMAGTLQTGSTIGVGAATPATSGAGITFPGTQSASSDANTLDDYEEGTYTPTFGGTSSNPTVTYTAQTGAYTKIGNMVYFYARITISAVAGGSGALQVSVPFTPRSGLYQAISCIYASLDLPADTVQLSALVNGDIATASFNACYDNAATTDLTTSALTASTAVTVTGCYVV
jgi:hypothetical protein